MGKRPSRYFAYQGRECSCAELAKLAGVTRREMYVRLHDRGMSAERAVGLGPVKHHPHPPLWKYTLNGQKMPVTDIAARLHYSVSVLMYRARTRGVGLQEVIDEEAGRQGI